MTNNNYVGADNQDNPHMLLVIYPPAREAILASSRRASGRSMKSPSLGEQPGASLASPSDCFSVVSGPRSLTGDGWISGDDNQPQLCCWSSWANQGDQPEPLYLTIAQVAALIQISERTIYRWASTEPTFPV